MEKKSIKVSLSTVFLILALIVIIAMAYYIYIEKTDSDKEISTLEANAVELQNTINDLQDKIDTISNTINSTTNAEINNSQTNNTSSSEDVNFSDKEIKESLTNYLNIFKGYGSIEGILENLELLEYGEYSNSELTSDNYRKTDIKYSEFKNAVLNYMTEDWFNTINTGYDTEAKFKDQNGLLYYNDVGLTGTEYVVESITLKGDYSDSRYIANVYSINPDDSKNVENIEFEITNYNGKCVISYCD